MKKIYPLIVNILKGMSRAGERFPLTVLCLIGATGIVCYLIGSNKEPDLLVQKMVFTLAVGAALGMVVQSAIERFSKFWKYRWPAYGGALLLTAGYFGILFPAPEIGAEIGIRTLVAIFSMICAVLWIPSCSLTDKSESADSSAEDSSAEDPSAENSNIIKVDFNIVALIHFKSIFTSALYTGVLSAGIAAILGTVNILLFTVDDDAYAYTMAILWGLFATIYYLSLLPRFGSQKEEDRTKMDRSDNYPKFLEILVSYIAIPLITGYTLVFIAYFAKILVTFTWPSGQLGPMVLAYAAAGLVVFVLSSPLQNRFAIFYRNIFPKVLIPCVIMQLISVGIRLNAYGITEARYYVALFGLFSIAAGVLLSFRPVSKNGLIALLAAGFALFSILPPVDAFTMSRNSQIDRLEQFLTEEGILADGQLTPKENASQLTKTETTNILSYLDMRSSLKYIEWLPEDFNMYEDMKTMLGFEPSWGGSPGEEITNLYAYLDSALPLNISGYDIALNTASTPFTIDEPNRTYEFEVEGNIYSLAMERTSRLETILQVRDGNGEVLIETGLYDFAFALASTDPQGKEAKTPEEMTLITTQNGYKLAVVFQNISITQGDANYENADYQMYLFFQAE